MAVSRKAAAGIAGITAAGIALAVPMTAKWEGMWTTAKPDRLAYNIPTVCFGETEGVRLGDTYTPAQCYAMLAKKLPRYASEIARCIHVPISDKEWAAYTTFAYNVGSAGFCRSTTAQLLNAGDHKGACDALMSWTRAGGQIRKGLVNRRADERKTCLEGVASIGRASER